MASKELKCFQDQIAIHNNGDDNDMTDCNSDSGNNIVLAIWKQETSLTKGLRACPICPECGSKKFKVIDDNGGSSSYNDKINNTNTAAHTVIVECLVCTKKIAIQGVFELIIQSSVNLMVFSMYDFR